MFVRAQEITSVRSVAPARSRSEPSQVPSLQEKMEALGKRIVSAGSAARADGSAGRSAGKNDGDRSGARNSSGSASSRKVDGNDDNDNYDDDSFKC